MRKTLRLGSKSSSHRNLRQARTNKDAYSGLDGKDVPISLGRGRPWCHQGWLINEACDEIWPTKHLIHIATRMRKSLRLGSKSSSQRNLQQARATKDAYLGSDGKDVPVSLGRGRPWCHHGWMINEAWFFNYNQKTLHTHLNKNAKDSQVRQQKQLTKKPATSTHQQRCLLRRLGSARRPWKRRAVVP